VPSFFNRRRREIFRAVAEAALPATREYTADEWAAAEQVIEGALADRPASVGRQIGLFLSILDLLPFLTRARSFRALPAQGRLEVLESLQEHRLLLFRRGVWGVRTLVYMGHYTRTEVHRSMGYGAHPRGRARPSRED